MVLHGHAHRGQLEGVTNFGIPVYNVSMPLLTRTFADRPPFRVFEVLVDDCPLGETAPAQSAQRPEARTVATALHQAAVPREVASNRRFKDSTQTCSARALGDPASDFYIESLTRLQAAQVPFLVGGAFAYSRYSKIDRETKDFDVFVRREDISRALTLFEEAGYPTELPFPHWLGKVHCGDDYVMDLIFSSGNGLARVDDLWFEHAVDHHVLGVTVRLCPVEELIWMKAFVQERERFDGADVMHLFRELGPTLDWQRLLMRFGNHWRVLFGHIVVFGFVYPDARDRIPARIVDELVARFAADRLEPNNRVCGGTLLSREQYLDDLIRLGYGDARVEPYGLMTRQEAEIWTAAINATK
jgi:hypothetical protein